MGRPTDEELDNFIEAIRASGSGRVTGVLTDATIANAYRRTYRVDMTVCDHCTAPIITIDPDGMPEWCDECIAQGKGP